MICTRLAGGLGNQLFQFAASLALRGDAGEPVWLDTDGLRRYRAPRSFDLGRLVELPPGVSAAAPPGTAARAALALLRLRAGRLLPRHGVSDRNFARQLARRAAGARRGLWLDGYFQQHWPAATFEATAATIAALLRHDLPASRVPAAAAVVHIRGGDFLASEIHRVVDTAYYLAALAALRPRLPPHGAVSVVTDDPAHAQPIVAALQQAHPDLRFSLAPPAPQHGGGAPWLHDFMLLRDAPARVIGNSSFAWWAAALDPRRQPTVSPDQWLRGVRRDLALPWETLIAA